MTPQEKRLFNEFREEILKYEVIDHFTMEMLLNRFISQITTRRFFNDGLKRRYYSFWIKMLVKEGKIESKGLGFKVNG